MRSIGSWFRVLVVVAAALVGSICITGMPVPAGAHQAQYVIEISIDGGGSTYIQALIDQGKLPNFKRFQTQGAWTNNARNDYDITVTLPNHVTMVTGRSIKGSDGHMWTLNTDPSSDPAAATYSIQNNKGSYVSGVFDVVHDNGLKTALYATKSKFSLFSHSYNSGNGSPDTTGPDNGVNKIDSYVNYSSSATVTTYLVEAMKTAPFNYALVHYTDGDTAGHASGWGSTAYNNALILLDGYLGSIFDLVTTTPALQGKTDIILTADHGGHGYDHSLATDALNYTIPLYVWGPDAEAGADLYALNQSTRLDPGTSRPAYTDPVQPIRNGELANLALSILGLGAVPGSTINPARNLAIASSSAVGVCGSDNGKVLAAEPVDLCAKGIASAINGTGPWTWSCTNGGSSVACATTDNPAPVITTTAPLPSGSVNVPYTTTLFAEGGTPPYLWSVSSGLLPQGLTMNGGTGEIGGTPVTAGSSTFTVTVTDAQNSTGEKQFTLAIAGQALQITTTSLPQAKKKVAYRQALGASGGTPPYTWSLSSGRLPSGLSLNSATGVISGKASKSGTSSFTVRVTDAKGGSATRSLTITVI